HQDLAGVLLRLKPAPDVGTARRAGRGFSWPEPLRPPQRHRVPLLLSERRRVRAEDRRCNPKIPKLPQTRWHSAKACVRQPMADLGYRELSNGSFVPPIAVPTDSTTLRTRRSSSANGQYSSPPGRTIDMDQPRKAVATVRA